MGLAYVLMLLLLVVVSVAVVVVGWFSLTIILTRRKYRHIPSPKIDNFFLGHLPIVIKYSKNNGNGFEAVFEWYKTQGSFFVVFFIRHPLAFTLNADDMKKMAVDQRVKQAPFLWETLGHVLGQRFQPNFILMIMDFEEWKVRRKMYNPGFKRSHLKNMLPTILKSADEAVDRLKQAISDGGGQGEVLMKEQFSMYTLVIIGRVGFGKDFTNSLKLKNNPGKWTFSELNRVAFTGQQHQMNNPLYRYMHPWKSEEYREAACMIRQIGKDCIQERIAAVKNGEEVPNDILSTILKIGINEQDFTIEDLVDDFVGFYGAGQLTTASLLSFALIEIILHPTILDRLLKEIDSVLQDNASITSEVLDKLTYMDQVLKETLRLYPAVPGSMKYVPKGYELSGYVMPEATEVMLANQVTSRLKENFENPLHFDPGHFDPSKSSPKTFAYFPFGLGYRSCIGRQLAMMQAKVILCKLLPSFIFRLPDGYKPEIVARNTFEPKDKVPVTVTLR